MTDGLQVVAGEPDAEELAAVIALFAARGVAGGGDEAAPRSGRWADPAWAVRRPLRSRPGAWRASTH